MNEHEHEDEQEKPQKPATAEATEGDNVPIDGINLSALEIEDEEKTEEELAASDTPPTYEELESEVASLKDQLLRALAETENIRRRGERERSDMSKYATANFAREILSVADNLQRAIDSVDDTTLETNEDLKTLFTGIEITANELPAAFDRFGIKPIDALGKRFDHNFHQAMFELDDPNQPAGTVVQVVQGGYMIYDRLLRPAMVGVSKGGPKPDDDEAAPSEDETAVLDQAEKAAADSSAAYEKQAEAEPDDRDAGSQLDTEL